MVGGMSGAAHMHKLLCVTITVSVQDPCSVLGEHTDKQDYQSVPEPRLWWWKYTTGYVWRVGRAGRVQEGRVILVV